jgi:hypothetical protein
MDTLGFDLFVFDSFGTLEIRHILTQFSVIVTALDPDPVASLTVFDPSWTSLITSIDPDPFAAITTPA